MPKSHFHMGVLPHGRFPVAHQSWVVRLPKANCQKKLYSSRGWSFFKIGGIGF